MSGPTTAPLPEADPTPHIDPVTSVDALMALVASGATISESTGPEAVDQLAHALQCGYELLLAAPDDVELAVAGLVHDIGHLIHPADQDGHGRVAADAVRGLLGDRVARLAALHVPAKRYLVATDATYRARLSPASTRSLQVQGGGMRADEVSTFRRLPDAEAAVRLRYADEAAKVPGREVPGLDSWRPLLFALAADVAADSDMAADVDAARRHPR